MIAREYTEDSNSNPATVSQYWLARQGTNDEELTTKCDIRARLDFSRWLPLEVDKALAVHLD